MEFKDIKTRTVTPDHKARPKDTRTKEDISLIIGEVELQLAKSRERIVRLKFEQFAQQHVYHCSPSLVAGEYPAEMFGEPIEQGFYPESGWVTQDVVGNNSIWELMPKRQYLQLKQPVQNPPDCFVSCGCLDEKDCDKLMSERIKELEKENIIFRQALAKISTYAANNLKPKGDDTINDIIDTVRPGINPYIKIR